MKIQLISWITKSYLDVVFVALRRLFSVVCLSDDIIFCPHPSLCES